MTINFPNFTAGRGASIATRMMYTPLRRLERKGRNEKARVLLEATYGREITAWPAASNTVIVPRWPTEARLTTTWPSGTFKRVGKRDKEATAWYWAPGLTTSWRVSIDDSKISSELWEMAKGIAAPAVIRVRKRVPLSRTVIGSSSTSKWAILGTGTGGRTNATSPFHGTAANRKIDFFDPYREL